ncbi:MAG: DUF3185 family protein [Dehalococcoidales bacterium]|nr:DUF3185 family protein [Dehalococcoidales bacterium]
MMFDYWGIPVIIGAVIFVLGIGLIIWGIKEAEHYYDSLVNRFDLREFFTRWPIHPEPGALKAGGWIAIAVGIVTAGIGGLLYWLGK